MTWSIADDLEEPGRPGGAVHARVRSGHTTPPDGPPARGRRSGAVIAAAIIAVGAVVLGAHALNGAHIARDWYAGDPGGLADLAWRQTECLGASMDELVPAGAAVHIPIEAGPLAQRLIEHAFRGGPVVRDPTVADIVVTIIDTPGQGCGGVTLSTLPVPPPTSPGPPAPSPVPAPASPTG